MNCFEFRQLRLSDPYTHSNSADQHRDGCSGCLDFEQEIATLDRKVHESLSVDVPEGFAAKILLNQSLQSSRKPTRLFWLSMAASFFAVTAIVTQFLQPANSPIEEPLLAHIQHKPHEFYGAGHQPITGDKLERVMGNLNLEASLENVVYAAICPVDGEMAAHLVIKDGEDQYTVMLIPDRSPSKTFEVDNEIWRGYISPHPAGALAVLADANHPDAVAHIREMSEKYQSSLYLAAEI